ncbi:hypothetical protein, partial [Acinetobacter oleivorans]|uniref:hypothetical protein n=1 Tax=Acinetobacter oleivorans TaxID=1148157 RepID=UPI001C2EDD2C
AYADFISKVLICFYLSYCFVLIKFQKLKFGYASHASLFYIKHRFLHRWFVAGKNLNDKFRFNQF